MKTAAEIEQQLRTLIGETLRTKHDKPFEVTRVERGVVWYEERGRPKGRGEIATYEACLSQLASGESIDGPGAVRTICPKSRTASYEWGILKHLKFVS